MLVDMRRPEYSMSPAEAREFLASCPAVKMAFTAPDGTPVLRTLHGVIVDDVIAFHAAPVGEKRLASGMPVVIAAEEVVASIPSYFVHPERACPATTFYRSVQVHGVVRDVTDPARKARVLQALMEKLQPEGGYLPISADHPMYKASVNGLWIFEIPLGDITGKAKLGQNRRPDEMAEMLAHLWRRGDPADPIAIEALQKANPETATPLFLSAPAGFTLHVSASASEAAAVADLLAETYWNQGIPREELICAHLNATAWVLARDAHGRVVASARALSDRGKWAWIYDVVVAPDVRGKGLGKAIVRLLLDHPALRGVRTVCLATKDAQGLYAQFGFVDRRALPPKPYVSTEMVRHGKMAVLA
jgi:N-acetylglutamate synthase-like GNAT family acetyltransferase/nitroimidazol reductase NimA-like FMN-containing flavoprotein (pyridoxamine 5'-phosphate oxidase superfamily)